MYKVEILSTGKYDNTVTGTRYCLTKKSAIEMVALCEKWECDFSVSKFIRLAGLVYSWSSKELGNNFWNKVNKKLERLEREE
jgi:hypothetical protein